jgi:Rps23 Pro-64 3,4-dihydroxylase Tpa1-like proline 4-hydroxylase
MKINQQDPSIVEFQESLDLNFCKEVIHKFNKDSLKTKAQVVMLDQQIVDESVRQAQVLNISDIEHWKKEDKIFFESLAVSLQKYLNHIEKIFYKSPFICPPVDSGYEIQKTIPKGFFKWHADAINNTVPMRKLTYMWYLNSCEEGCTEFAFGQKIKPEAGKLLIFPSTWPYVHQGTPPKTTKYVCTGWLS